MSVDINSNNSKLLAENVLKRIQEYRDPKFNVSPYLDATLEVTDNGNYIIQSKNCFKLYLPSNFDEIKDINYYFQGTGGGTGTTTVDDAIDETMKSYNSDKILLEVEASKEKVATDIMGMVNPDGFTHYNGSGWSAGAPTSLNYMTNLLANNKDLPPQTLCLFETAYNGTKMDITDSQINLLKDNNTTVVLFEDTNNTGYKDNKVFKKLASNLNVVMIESKSDHTLVPTDAFYENVLGFINGDASKLNSFSGKYKYSVYDNKTDTWKEIDEKTALSNLKNNSDGSNSLVFKPEYVLEAIRLSKNAALDISSTPSTIQEAIELSSSVQVDLSDWIYATSDALVQIEAVGLMEDTLRSIYNELMPLDDILSKFLKTYDGDVTKVPKFINEMVENGQLDKSNVSSLIQSFVRTNVLNASNLKDVVPQIIVDGNLSSSDLVDLSYNCQMLLASQGVNENGKTNYEKTGYYNSLEVTTNPVLEIINTLMNKGFTEEQAKEYIDGYNSSLGQKLINENSMYTGKGVATSALATTGLFTTFGYMLDYSYNSFESDGKNGLMLGTDGRYVSTLDCNNSFDFFARCAGINASGYNAANKEKYAVTIDERIRTGHDDVNYWHEKMVEDGRVQEYLNKDGTVNSDFKTGNPGDIIVCKSGSHMFTIVNKDANGYYVAEETCNDTRGSGLRIHYYNYEDIAKLTNSSGYEDTNPYVVHMDNLYSNTTNVFKERNFVTYGYDVDGNVIEIKDNITYGDNSSTYGHCNNYIPPEVISSKLNLNSEVEELLKGEYNKRNENGNVSEYKISDVIPKKLDELDFMLDRGITKKNNTMELPNVGKSIKRWSYASSVTSTNSNQYRFLNNGLVSENEDGYMIYNDGDGNDYYCVAMGSYYSDNTVGKKFKIDLDNGKSIYAITGDVKSDKATDINHQYSGTNGKETMLSFIVGDDFAYKYPGIGNCSKTIPELSGDIAKVHYLGDINTEINTSNVTIEDCAWNLE